MNSLQPNKNNFNVLLKRDNQDHLFTSDFINIPDSIVPNIMIGDVFDCLKKIPDKSISVVVTSPPYWNLRDYNSSEQIGIENNPQKYIDKIVNVGNQILRVLKDDGAYFLNIGDTYVDKNLQMIPQRVAIGMQKNGWLIRNQLIWYKPNHMPSPVKSRFKNTYEPIYFFTKNDWEKKVKFDLDAIRIPHKTKQMDIDFKRREYNGKFKNNEKNIGASPGGRVSVNNGKYTTKRKFTPTQQEISKYLRFWKDKKNINNSEIVNYFGEDYKYTVGHWFRKDAGGSLPTVEDWNKLKKLLRFDDKYDKQMTEMITVPQIVRNHPNGKNPGDLLSINTAKTHYEHFAVFPEEIPNLAIKSCCPKDGVVLDPFAGSGTTGLSANKLNRRSILIDIQENFLEIIRSKIGIINHLGKF
jgi:site-specific DNA-methyltransferase (adenine-specific)